jgi:polyphosphate kinase
MQPQTHQEMTMDAVDLAAGALGSATVSAPSTAPSPDGDGAASRSFSLPPDRYSDRELSWLAFNNRVLDLAKDRERVPLLERAKFLAIFSSNLDEFFMVRVAGLKRRIAAGVAVPTVSGMMPRDVHAAILRRTRELVTEQARVFTEEVRPELSAQGIEILRWDGLTPSEKARMRELFAERIFPVLTPLAVDPSHPFPYISGLSINLAVMVRNPDTGARQFARVKVPTVLPRFLPLSEGRYVPLEDVIARHLDQLFSGMQIVGHHVFRVTRNEDLEVEEDDAENLLLALEKELLRRKVGRPPVRLEVEDDIDPKMLELLVSELDISEKEVFLLPGPLDLRGLFSLSDIDRAELKYPAFVPSTHPHLAEVETARPADMFAALKQRDVLLQHPYDSFATSVQRFIEQAADDPQVLAIKQTLYRTSGDSPIVDALIEAAEAGKQVLALVEIKARFDEQANIAWARRLERHGVHVVYGLLGLKTHCKLSMVVRDEPDGLRRYAHIGTGNYNPKTARLYEDIGLLTANPIVTDDVGRLFNHLSGMSQETGYKRLLVAPHGIRTGLLDRINNEIANFQDGLPAGIRIKVNSLVDEAVIDGLYRASRAGVPVDLWIRGICALRPGVEGLSENIRVRSILGRFLEHSRLFWFANAGQSSVGIGSADLMHRNLDRRVEVLVSITNPSHVAEIADLFELAFDPGTASWQLQPDGTWLQCTVDATGKALLDMQEYLINVKSRRRVAK